MTDKEDHEGAGGTGMSGKARECGCSCHAPGSSEIHFMPCCDGGCLSCQKHWHNLRKHMEECCPERLTGRKRPRHRKEKKIDPD